MEQFLGLPEVASAHGGQIDHVIGLVHWLMLALFLLWGTLFVYILVRFRQSANPKADYNGLQSHLSSYAEVGVAVVEVVLLVGFSIPLYSERVDNLPPEGDATVVRVVGEQFAWNVHYPGPDGQFGRTDIDLIDIQTNPLGLDRDDPLAKDDVTLVNQLHFPVDRPVLIRLSSKDVIHNFGIPEMRIKQDAIPGMEFPVWFEPTVTTANMRTRVENDQFNYEVGCFQLCGNGHARMRALVTIETREEFDAWMAEQQEYLGGEEEDEFWG